MLLLKQGEIVLKGLNRRAFEAKLLANLRRALAPHGEFRVYAMQSTIYAEPVAEDDRNANGNADGKAADMDGALAAASRVFGLVSVTRALACEKDADALYRTAAAYLGDELRAAKSFKVAAKRADKRFPMTSIQLAQYVGGLLSDDFPDIAVDMHNPELTVTLEVRDRAAYVHATALRGAGGLPVGTGGRCVSLLSGGIDSPVSTYMAAKRGLSVIPLHFASPPYTSPQALEKVVELTRLLAPHCGKLTLEVVPFTKLQEQIGEHCPEEYYTIIMRRFMMRIAERVAARHRAACLVTGENLGQVASQTVEAMRATETVTSLPVLRPVICHDKREIVEVAERIGTFATSILPFEDCCTVFTPRRPATKPKLDRVALAESALDVNALVDETFNGIYQINI
jgi:thiamine biosynthesis protein ThiI